VLGEASHRASHHLCEEACAIRNASLFKSKFSRAWREESLNTNENASCICTYSLFVYLVFFVFETSVRLKIVLPGFWGI
jgi:hypothetical protein